VDLGAPAEASSVAVVDRTLRGVGEPFNHRVERDGTRVVTAVEEVEVVYEVRHLRRFSPPYRYGGVARHTAEVVAELGEALVGVDVTRTGRPTFSTIRNAVRKEVFGDRTTFFPVTISWSGAGVTHGTSGFVVPRRDLVFLSVELFESQRLKIAKGMELSGVLVEEYMTFKPARDPKDDLEGWRLGRNDDLVLATSLACWISESYVKRTKTRPVGVSRVEKERVPF
jgi:hypothetical protein